MDRIYGALSGPLFALGMDALQVNLGLRCNMSCGHCHLEAGPSRTEEMGPEVVGYVMDALLENDIPVLDVTGGAPELNPHFRRLVEGAAGAGRRVIVRTNLTVFFEAGLGWIPGFLADNRVEVVASLPHYTEAEVDRMRGGGTFAKSIEALRILNTLGYADGRKGLILSLVHNPQGACLAPPEGELEGRYRKGLRDVYGIGFNRLMALSNMPLGRFGGFLDRSGMTGGYMQKLADSFNPGTMGGLMCRRQVSVAWDGRLYDCDFNLALVLPLHERLPGHVREFNYEALSKRRISMDEHCLACTAGRGST